MMAVLHAFVDLLGTLTLVTLMLAVAMLIMRWCMLQLDIIPLAPDADTEYGRFCGRCHEWLSPRDQERFDGGGELRASLCDQCLIYLSHPKAED